MKPDTKTAMRALFAQVREIFPFDLPEAQICQSDCNGCSLKLLEFIDNEMRAWESRLDAGEIPNFGDLNRFSKTAKKVYKVLQKNDLV